MPDTIESRHAIRVTLRGWIGRSEDRLLPEIHAGDVARTLAADPHAPVVIDLECHGGFTAEAWRLHDVIQNHAGVVSAGVGLKCDSGGIIPFLAAEKRACSPWASFLLHPPRFWRCDLEAELYTASDLRDLANNLDDENGRIVALLSERTTERGTYWRGRCETADPGWPVCAVEALRSGLVHQIEVPQ
jgi:ATP-dependent protease ClpP protease subunit